MRDHEASDIDLKRISAHAQNRKPTWKKVLAVFLLITSPIWLTIMGIYFFLHDDVVPKFKEFYNLILEDL